MRRWRIATQRSQPFRRRRDRLRWGAPGVRPAGALQPADGTDRHVLVAEELARQANTGQALGLEDGFFGGRLLRRLVLDELHAARGASGVSAACMQDVDLGVLFNGQDESLAVGHVERPVSFNSQCRHTDILREMAVPERWARRGCRVVGSRRLLQIASACFSTAIRFASYPSSRSTACVCSPRVGGGVRTLPALSPSLTGTPSTYIWPAVGWVMPSTIIRAASCGSESTCARSRTAPHGTPACFSVSTH